MIATHKAANASSSVAGKRSLTNFVTGSLNLSDLPKSPVTARVRKSQYCTISGLIQAPFVARPLDIRGRGVVAEQQSHRIARRDMHQQENEKRDTEEDRNRANDPATKLVHAVGSLIRSNAAIMTLTITEDRAASSLTQLTERLIQNFQRLVDLILVRR